MIYLIQDRDYLKIGYSANMDQRKKAYETTNCYAEIIMTKDGSRKDEAILHKLCEKWHYKNEWFYYNDEIIEIFKNYTPDQDQRISALEEKVDLLIAKVELLSSYISTFKEIINDLTTINNIAKDQLNTFK